MSEKKLKRLSTLIDHPLSAAEDLQIGSVVYDSRKTTESSLFVAIKGFAVDGHSYLEKARQNGAVAAVVAHINKAVDLPQYIVADTRKALADIAARFFQPEISKLRIAGVTGTNGKTTTSYLIRSVFNAAGIASGLIGTIQYEIGKRCIKAWNTTPESVDIFQMMYDMVKSGQNGCVLEASSHGLALNRLDNIGFDIAVFTNLSQDHLDFHNDFEDYFQAKKKLFSLLRSDVKAVINLDDPYGDRLCAEIQAEIIDFSTTREAAVMATEWKNTLAGLHINVHTPLGPILINSKLIGEFNVENILATVAAGIGMNFDLETIKRGIENVNAVPGRLQPVPVKKDIAVIVDYSHTPDALQKALKVLGGMTKNNVWVVFGCGGDRDKKKRPIMGEIASTYAQHVIVTSDNPRSETPATIIDAILNGISDRKNTVVRENRREAIKYALDHALPGDTVLVAGKGHEDYQEISGVKHPFDDRLVIRELMS